MSPPSNQGRPSLRARAQTLLNRVISPSTRRAVAENLSAFVHERPLLASFILINLLLSFTPIALFLSFTLGLFLVAFLSALAFTLFWAGLALLVLLPTLCVTATLGVGVWAWAVATFVCVRWLYRVVPVRVSGETEVGLPNGRRVVVEKGREDGVKAEVRGGGGGGD